MTQRQVFLLAVVLVAGCGSRVIGNLGDATDGSPNGGAPQGGMLAQGASHQNPLPSTQAGAKSAVGGAAGGQLTDVGGDEAGGAAVGGSEAGGSAAGGDGAAGSAAEGGVSGWAAGGGGQAGGADLPPLTAVPVAHFKLDECDGDAVDTQSASVATRYGVDCADGLIGKAGVFSADASDTGPRRIELPIEPRFDFTHALTVTAWVKPEAGPQVRTIVGKWYGKDSFQLSIREVLVEGGQLSPRFAFSIAEPEGEWGRPSDAISLEEVELGVWAHVAGVYSWSANGQVGHITLYVNGRAVAETSTKVGTDGLQQSTRPVTIGYVEDGAQFVGLIDEVRLYDVALGPELGWLYLDPAHE